MLDLLHIVHCQLTSIPIPTHCTSLSHCWPSPSIAGVGRVKSKDLLADRFGYFYLG